MSGRRRLIVNADDFGRAPGINAGIIKAHREGIVTSTTLMVNLAWTEAAVTDAAAVPALALGLHLNFCYGRPVSEPAQVPSLVDVGGCLETDTRLLASRASAEDIRTETVAQLERFRQLVGREPTHLDSHKYLHSTPRFAPVVAEVAASCSLPVRSTSAEDRLLLRKYGVPSTDAFEGRFHGLDGDGVELALLLVLLGELGTGTTELMCHPGFVDEHINDSSYTYDREHELAALCSPEVRCALADGEIQLMTFEGLQPGD